MTKYEIELLELINNAEDVDKAIRIAFEIMELTVTFGDEFLYGGQKYLNEGDKEGFNAYIDEWKAKYNQMQAGLVS